MTRQRRSLALAAFWVAATSLAWLDPHQPVRNANELYRQGKYEDATAAYNAALVDQPDSDPLHFNLGDATYKQGKYDEAIDAFQKVETAGDPARGSRVAYNVGNAKFRQGQALEQSDPQKALGLYAEALVSYRRALGLTPDDQDSKVNHEFVTKRIDEVKKRLEEQKKEQDQQKQDQQQQQNQDQQQQDQQKPQDQKQQQGDQQEQQQQQQQQQQDQQKDEAQQDQQQQPQDQQQKDEQQRDQQQAGGEPKDEKGQDQQQHGQESGEPSEQDEHPEQQGEPAGDAVAGEKKDGELSKGEAAAILDSQRGEEVSPEDVIKKLQGARVAEPAQDW